MANTSLAVLALSLSTALLPVGSAMASPIGSPIHLHPRLHRADNRIFLSLHNESFNFREVKIDGHVYVVKAHGYISITAPVGTAVYSDSKTPTYRRGDVMLVVTPNLNNQQINLN